MKASPSPVSESTALHRRGVFAAALLILLSAHLGYSAPALAEDAGQEQKTNAERGRAMQAEVYADMPADDPWLKMGQEHLFAQIWTRPGLTIKERPRQGPSTPIGA